MKKTIKLLLAITSAALFSGNSAEADSPSSFPRHFDLNGDQKRMFEVTLPPSTDYTIFVKCDRGADVQLRVERYWQGQKKSDVSRRGRGGASYSFRSTHHGHRPYRVTVWSPSGQSSHCDVYVNRIQGGFGGTFPAPGGHGGGYQNSQYFDLGPGQSRTFEITLKQSTRYHIAVLGPQFADVDLRIERWWNGSRQNVYDARGRGRCGLDLTSVHFGDRPYRFKVTNRSGNRASFELQVTPTGGRVVSIR